MFLHLLWRASSGETRCKAQAPFSHLSGTECKPAYESMLHLLAKEKIQEAFYNRTSLYIEFEYTSFCSQDKCIFYAIQVDVLVRERRGLTLRNGMILVSRKSRMTILEGVAT